MSRSSTTWAPPPSRATTPHVHPAVQELVPHPHVQGADGLDVLRSHQRPRTTHVIVWDTETTGREHDARIVEIAAARVRLADGVVESMWSQLVNPGCRIPAEVSQIHGIDDAAVRGAPTIAQVLPVFIKGAVRRALPLVAHNATFDLARVTHEAQRCDIALPGTLSVHCSLEASRKLHRTVGHGLPSSRRATAWWWRTRTERKAMCGCWQACCRICCEGRTRRGGTSARFFR